jgi:hypothetical protein
MGQINRQADFINLSFSLESNASLWNIVFEGFDQEVILISKFEGRDIEAIKMLIRFGTILKEKYKDCQVEFTNSGLKIRKKFPKNDIPLIREWSELMYDIRREMTALMKESLD